MTWKPVAALSAVLAMGAALSAASAADLPAASPESVGFSSARLQRLDATMADLVKSGQFAGMATVLTRHGKVVAVRTYGRQDLASGAPMRADTIVRAASMTKPITAVAMMLLYEEGKWRPEDTLAQHIPEFADLRVFAGLDKDGKPILEKPAHAPTVGELMSQTAGFTYGFSPATNPVDKMYAEAGLRDAPSLVEFIQRLSKLPLLYQPGSRWVYSYAVDIQGYLVEKLSGQSLPDFTRDRIFTPLGMKDSGFYVPEAKLGRLATIYRWDAGAHGLVPVASPFGGDPKKPPGMPSGGGGLYSTAADYARFAQMLAGRGEVGGVRILAPSSVALMGANHLSDRLLANGEFGLGLGPNGFTFPDTMKTTDAFGIAFYRARPGIGFGYDVGVIYDPPLAGRTVGKGTMHWDGAFGTWFWSDPTNDVAFVGIVQRADLPAAPNVQELTRTLVYQALVEPEK